MQVSDNVSAASGGGSAPWTVLAGFIGATIAVLIREGIEYWRRPRLKIDFEGMYGKKPYVGDYEDRSIPNTGSSRRVKFLRVIVRNEGRKPAMDCEAKLELVERRERDTPLGKAGSRALFDVR